VSLRARLSKALLASLCGWIVGMAAAMPFQIAEAIRTAGSDLRLLASALGLALALWILLSLAVACFFCCFFLLPVVFTVSPEWFLQHRVLWMLLSTGFGVSLVAVRGHVWSSLDHDGVSLINFWMWGTFAASFCLTTSACYAKFCRTFQPVR
jgi:hypothetical protein